MAASYPTAAAVFPARSDGQTIFSQHINALQDEIAALEASLIGGSSIGLPSPQRIMATGGLGATLVLGNSSIATLGRIGYGINGDITMSSNVAGVADDASKPAAQIAMGGAATGYGFSFMTASGPDPRTYATVMKVDPTGKVYERSRTFPMGEWQDVPFNVANFWPGVTAGMVQVNRFLLLGRLMVWQVQIGAGGGCPAPVSNNAYLQFSIPSQAGGLMVASVGVIGAINIAADNGVNQQCLTVMGNQGLVFVQKWTGVAWTGPNVTCTATFLCAML